MGLAFSSEVGSPEEAFRECTDGEALGAAVVVAEFLVRSAVAPTDDLLPVAAALLLRDGAVATAAVERALEGRLAAAAVAACEEEEITSLAPSLLLLDPALARARHRCVPSRLPEAAWWAVYVDALLAAAAQQLPRLLRQERACGVLRELAGAPVGGDGQLSRLPADALARVACCLPAASVLSLGGASRALFALGHADPVWRQLVARDFPDVEAGGRARYEAVARGQQGVPPGALEAVDGFLRARWGGRCCVYGGWGSPHLAVTMLWRSAGVCHRGLEPQICRPQAGLLLTRLSLALDRRPPCAPSSSSSSTTEIRSGASARRRSCCCSPAARRARHAAGPAPTRRAARWRSRRCTASCTGRRPRRRLTRSAPPSLGVARARWRLR